MTAPVLQMRGVSKVFGSHWVLQGVDLELADGTATALIGASGSGKSTLLRCANLLEQVDDGVIELDGRDITDPRVDPDEVRRHIGVVFQAYNLFPHRSVLDNITLAPRKVHGVAKAEAEERARELLSRFGLADKATDYPDRLSGGQQQRVAIVRAIATRPRLLLLDEVTSALDPELVDDGVIELDGRDITDPRVDPDEVRRHIGVVFQAYNLFPHRSVLDNITLAPRKVHGVPRAEAEDRARALLARFGLADKATDYPDRLSGGQQQRVAIVRAIATRPRLLLLDEVTSALDPELVGEVLELVKELKTEGMTMLLATHEMAFAREVADVVCFLDQGVVCERGPAAQVLSAPQQERTQQFLRRVLA